MIQDLRTIETNEPIRTDVCIVGAGAAGITLAVSLAEQGVDVCLVEAGDDVVRPEAQALFEGESVGEPMAVDGGRYRVLGGATRYWTGRCAKLDPIDFERRPWAPGSGWPFPREVLEPYYRRAEATCGFRTPWISDAAVLNSVGAGGFAFDKKNVELFAWRYAAVDWARYQDWGVRFGGVLRRSPRIRVLLNANLTEVIAGADQNRVSAVVVRSLSGARGRIEAKRFVLACGGIENARLLLNAAERQPRLFDRAHAALGRYFMQHPRAVTAAFTSAPGAGDPQDLFNVLRTRRGSHYEVGFALPAETQRRLNLVNCSACFRYEADPLSSWERTKQWLRREAGATPVRDRLDPLPVLGNILRRLGGRHALLEGAGARLILDLEQLPDPDSRITLSPETDALGLRKARIDWRISEVERRTARVFTRAVGDELERLGLGRMTYAPGLDETGGLVPEAMHESYHHLGATRMSDAPATGPVDADGRVHGTANLYVAGGSVMATGGHANPTFTIVALALRLADHLAETRDTAAAALRTKARAAPIA